MSSAASSSSSKLSQFGLYRAIDARTEEFLRLSRRRQIRQGCACAAVSTAITVTVVITVVLVYEFTINFDSGFNEKQDRQDWLDSYNNSVYHPSSKSKAEIESLNAKILPVIAKIFNKGEIPMRKNVEQGIKKNVKETQTQTSTPSSISDKMRRSDTPFEKLFWSKMSPSQNTYTDPKSPPSMVNFKNQLKNLDYYRKIRNIKNYQRMLGYFDKMISNPLTLPSTKGLMKSESEPPIYRSSTEKSSHIQSMRKKTNKANTIQINPLFTTLTGKANEKSTTASNGNKITNIIYLRTTPGTTILESSLIATRIAKNENNKTCNCDSQLLYLLSSLVTNIQDLLPKLKLYKASCSNDIQDNISHKEFETDVESQDNHSILKSIVPHGTIVNDMTAINETQKENSSDSTSFNDLSQKLYVLKTKNNITHQNYTIVLPENLTKNALNDSDTIKSYTKSATPEETSVKAVTESVSSTIDLKEEDIVSALNEGFNDSFSNNNATNTTNDELSKLDVSNFDAIFNFSKLEDDNSTVENTEILSNVRLYTNVSQHNNITVTSIPITQRSKDKGNQSTENGELENDLNILDDFNFDKKLKLIYSQSYPVWTESEDEVEQRKSSEIYDSFNITNHVEKLKTRATLLDLFGKTSSKVLKQPVSAKKLDNMRIHNRKDDSRPHIMEYDEFQFLNEEQKEQIENSVLFENNAIKFDKYDTTMRKASNLDDSTSYVKSMLPVSRPIYLEVQRNDWKHENDYVILLIYEYGIAVDWSLVQINKTNRSNLAEDKPVADRLDRSYFGFDQDYFEKMPLLVNAMQENSNIEPTIDTTSVKAKARYIITNYSRPTSTTMLHRSSSIRRTSPRPFYFEYKSPTPTPFSKTYGSRSWVENYRNTQRLKNLQQVINYLEKTINAKFGDLYALPTSTIAFSGLYVEPVTKDNNQPKPTLPTADMISESSNKLETPKSNHKSDPLYNFKPDSPGDVNLLADGFFRFSPVPTPSLLKEKLAASIPMFRPTGTRKKKCIGHRCAESGESKIVSSRELTDFLGPEAPSYDKPKSFSVMLNVVPLKPTNLDSFDSTQVPIPTSKIYITTPRPIIQFRRKSTTPVRRITTTRFKNPRFLPTRKYMKAIHVRSEEKRDIEPKIIVHMNVYPSSEVKDQVAAESTTLTSTSTSSTTQSNAPRYSTEIPMLTSTQVEDYHVGSSGIIPVEARLTPAPPPPIPPEYIQSTTTTTMTPPTPIPFFDITTSSTETNYRTTIKSLGPTNPPEILKFSHEDAKIPDQYKRLMNIEETTKQTEMSRRNSQDGVEISDDYEDNPGTRTLLVKLRNKAEITSETTATTSEEINYDTTTVKTYVPQINGHYRSVNQNSKTINTWINESSETPESKRKRRLEMSVTGFRKSTYVPQYVEIKRNYTRNLSDEDKEE